MSDIEDRIRRLYAAVGETLEDDVASFAPEVTNRGTYLWTFRGDLSDEQIANRARQAIEHLAHLKDPLRRWAAQNGKNPEDVEATIDGSADLAIVVDLANVEKHGYPPRSSRSGRKPRLTDIMRALNLAAGGPGTVEIVPGPTGLNVHTSGSSRPRVVVTADVVDESGARIGDLATILERALVAWEDRLSAWRLLL